VAGLDDIKHQRDDDLIAAYKERYGDKTLLAFSRGKDSIAVALALRDDIEVIPFHYDDLPGLEFVEESLAYYEKNLRPAYSAHAAPELLQAPARRDLSADQAR
jgi:hypothetical protein